MNTDIKVNDLNIEIPLDFRDNISIRIDPNCNILVEIIDENKSLVSEIAFKKMNKEEIIDWSKTKKNLDSNLKESSVNSVTNRKVSLLISQNYEVINDYVKSIINSTNKENEERQKYKEIKIFKYYSEKEQRLYESILLENRPTFISYENGNLIFTEKITENTRTLIPFGNEDGAAKPYEFANEEEL